MYLGDAIVPVANCSEKQFDAHCKSEMKMSEFLDYWKSHIKEKEEEKSRKKERDTRRENGESNLTNDETRQNLLYLKDWHFCRLV